MKFIYTIDGTTSTAQGYQGQSLGMVDIDIAATIGDSTWDSIMNEVETHVPEGYEVVGMMKFIKDLFGGTNKPQFSKVIISNAKQYNAYQTSQSRDRFVYNLVLITPKKDPITSELNYTLNRIMTFLDAK